MLKKIVVGSLITVLVGAVVLAAYSYWCSSNYGPAGRGQYAAANHYGYRGRGQALSEREYRGQWPGQGRSQGRGDGYGLPQAQVEEWVTVEGEIVALDQTGLTVQTDDGQTLLISLGPSWFRENQEAVLKVGERVNVHYFVEDGELKAGEVTVEATGDRLLLRDPDGRPMWAGRGQRRGQQG